MQQYPFEHVWESELHAFRNQISVHLLCALTSNESETDWRKTHLQMSHIKISMRTSM